MSSTTSAPGFSTQPELWVPKTGSGCLPKIGSPIPGNYSFFRIADQLDTGNVLIKKHVFKKCGLFDRQFEKQRMGDGEFGLRSYKKGFISISNPVSKRVHLKVKTGGLRQLGSWDAFRPTNILGPSVGNFCSKGLEFL